MNGKAERFIRTALREWNHGHSCNNSIDRLATSTISSAITIVTFATAVITEEAPVSRPGLSGDNLWRPHTRGTSETYPSRFVQRFFLRNLVVPSRKCSSRP